MWGGPRIPGSLGNRKKIPNLHCVGHYVFKGFCFVHKVAIIQKKRKRAKFGYYYILNSKNKPRIPLYSWLLLELIIKIWWFEKKSLQNLANLCHLLHGKFLGKGQNNLFRSKFGKFSKFLWPIKKTLLGTLFTVLRLNRPIYLVCLAKGLFLLGSYVHRFCPQQFLSITCVPSSCNKPST